MEVPEGDWFCKHCRDHVPALEEGASAKTMMYGWGNNTSGCVSKAIYLLYSLVLELKRMLSPL